MDSFERAPVEHSKAYATGPDASSTQSISFEEAVSTVSSKFKSIDLDNDSHLTSFELKEAAKSQDFNPEERGTMAAMAASVAEGQKLSNDDWLWEGGLSKNDLESMKTLSANDDIRVDVEARLPGRDVHEKSVFGAILKDNFDKFDINHSHGIDQFELTSLSQSPDISADEREVATQLLKHFDDFNDMTTNVNDDQDKSYAGPLGPFHSELSKENEITRLDVESFNTAMVTQERFDKYLSDMRTNEIVRGVGRGIPMLYGTAMTIDLAIADPDPISKTVFGALAVTLGISTSSQIEVAWSGRTDLVRKECEQRQNMLDSWQYFK